VLVIIILSKKISKEQLKQAREVYADYIKTVLDVEKNTMAIGGEYHSDCEEVLIKSGSKPENLFGGGYRVSTKEIEYMAMSNYKPALGKNTYEIMDPDVRQKLANLTKEFLEI
jgi:hypothetical protein